MSEVAAVKIMPDMIKPFGGNVGDDVAAWIQKVEFFFPIFLYSKYRNTHTDTDRERDL